MKFKVRVRYFLIVSPMVLVLLSGCPSPSPVDEILTDNLAARGGLDRIKALQSLRLTGVATASDGRVAKIVREVKRPGFFRLEFHSQGTTSVFANDGEAGWMVAPLEGVFEPQEATEGADTAGGIDQRDIEGPLVGWREKGHAVALVGREPLDSGDAFKLKVTLNDGTIRYDYVDVESHLVVRSDVPRILKGHPVQLENTLSDFREVDGLVLPYHIEMKIKGRPEVIHIAIEKVDINPDLDDERFRLPE